MHLQSAVKVLPEMYEVFDTFLVVQDINTV